MNENIKKSRLLFELERKKHPMQPSEVVAGEHAVAGSSLSAARDTFSYERSMAEVEIGKEMLNGNSLRGSVERVIAKSSQNESTLTM